MGLIFRDRTDEKLEQLHGVLTESFSKVKQDATLLSQWVEYLYHLSIEQQRAMNDLRIRNNHLHGSLVEMERFQRRQNDVIKDLQLQLENMPATPDAIRKVVDSFYSFEPVLARMKHIEEKLTNVEAKQHVPEPVSVQKEQHYSLQEKIMRRITRHSKNFIKSSIMSLIEKYGKISALQLREMIVEEQGLCSKSSFYRLLEELEVKEGLQPMVDGKEKVYFNPSQAPMHKKDFGR